MIIRLDTHRPVPLLTEAELDANNAQKAERFCCDGLCSQGRGHCPAIYRYPRSLEQAFNTRAPIERPMPSMLRRLWRVLTLGACR